MQIPVLNGIYTDSAADFRSSYPVNLVPVPKENGISNGYLRPADGVEFFAEGPGIDRGGINWNGVCYRVMGNRLVSVNAVGVVTDLGEVIGSERARFAYSFDRLAIASGGFLYYYDGTLTRVTDPDLGTAIDVIWIDGYFMTTDGVSLVVTELTDPTKVDPLKYGSSEVDPDKIVALLKLRDEAYAVNRYTVEVFNNIGGDFFPFQRIDGAQLEKGAMGTNCVCTFGEVIAFLGSALNEPPAIYAGANGAISKISTREIDQILMQYTEAELSASVLEYRVDKQNDLLMLHLPDRCLVYDSAATTVLKESIWHVLTTDVDGFSTYRAKNFVWCYDKWIVGDPKSNRLGTMTNQVSSHWGELVRWEFGTTIVYNEGRGAIFYQLELFALTGTVAFGASPMISTSYSVDGENWSQEKFIRSGTLGQRAKRLIWLQQGHMRTWRIQRFRGTSDSHLTVARLEAQLEGLAY